MMFRLLSEKEGLPVSGAASVLQMIPEPGASKPPTAFILTREDGAELIGALGRERGFLNYFPPGYDGARSFSSADDLDLAGVFAFDLGSEVSEVEMAMTVDRERFLHAISDFCERKGLPRGIAWLKD